MWPTSEETWMVGDNLDWILHRPSRLGLWESGITNAPAKPDRAIHNLKELVERPR